MNYKWRFTRDIVLGMCYILDGLYLILLPGLTKGLDLSMRWLVWINKRYFEHRKRMKHGLPRSL